MSAVCRRRFIFGLTTLPFARTVSAATPEETVVLVHGLWMTGMESGLLRNRLQDDYGFLTRQYSYHSVQLGLDDNMRLLAEFIADVPGRALHLVGHSLGGLLALRMLEHHPQTRPGRVVCLGSPLLGSSAARAMASLPFGDEILGATIRDALLNSGMKEWRGAREVGVIAGTLGIGLGLVLDDMPSPNDGTVAVEETRLPGIKDHLEVAVSHTGLLVSGLVASQTAYFLRHGEFARPRAGQTG